MNRNAAKNISAVLLSSFVAFGLSDYLIFRLFEQDTRDQAGLYQKDDLRGHAHKTNYKGTVITTAPFPVTTNNHGYRDQSWSSHSPRKVLIVGDSFTFGEPLPIEEGFVYQLQQLYSPEEVKIFNAGVSGYGLAHILATIKKECPIISPTDIIYAYYFNDTRWDGVRTDATTVTKGHMGYAMDAKGNKYSEQQLHQRLHKAIRSRSWGLLQGLTLRNIRSFLSKRNFSINRNISQNSPQPNSLVHAEDFTPIKKTSKILQAIIEQARRCGAKFHLVILPSMWEAKYAISEPVTDELLNVIYQKQFKLLDLREHTKKGHMISLPYDNHYSPKTNLWVAEKIFHLLQEDH